MPTGHGADIILIDDPLKLEEARSDNSWRMEDEWLGSGGIFRQTADQRWEALTNGLPDETQVHAITVHPAVSGFMVTVFFLGFAISPLWTATAAPSRN